ncbi:glycosyltransferase family 4 protein [Vallicoccus soli]|uniref:Undecaprenyl/decaprenyl-phosphate alpha-N-acetylglucosaminyl 1-phosphate transferase n=1 Tax=Vallicoccus soli TaxID=2339232 RepID=A0A3A3Z1M5_9ACTN|nr:MraY family glycosyltransferase [Vallicoccus soli]RJK98149.1 undecaprenyl/decaprenyl-phosphate alpha-N-acetylglucosaminyl 1-phosphate transferase [Vallicoccus soli]
MRNYALVLLVAMAVTYLTTAPVRRLALRWGVMTPVRDRDVHDTPIPRMGGVAILAGLCAGVLVASKLPLLRTVFESGQTDWRGLLSGAVVICLLGAVDDRWGIDAVTKLAGQVLAGGVMALQGVQLFWLPFGSTTQYLPQSLGVLLSVLVVVVTINAVNFVDGLDGLAAGIVLIAAGSLFVYSYILSVVERIEYADTPTMITAVTAGCCLGFLPHNLHPARVFMGDSGSMLLGLLLAASTITLTGKVEPSGVTSLGLGPALLPLLLPVLVILVPLADLLLAVVRRTAAGRSPFAPDKQHLHHRLLEIGHSHRRAVGLMHLWAALLALGTLLVAIVDGPWPERGVAAAAVVALALTAGLDRAVARPGRPPRRPRHPA